MPRKLVVKGRVVGARTVELDEPLPSATKVVDVVADIEEPTSIDRILDFVRRLPPGTRGKEDIDHQLQEDRNSWER